jgi:hypothetical protein
MKLKTVTNKDWYKWNKDFHAEIDEEAKKLNWEKSQNLINITQNVPISEYFEWDGTHTTNDDLKQN